MVCFDAVDAAGPIGSGCNVVQVCSNHSRAAGTGAIDLGGGVVQALVGHLLTANGCSDSWWEVDVAFIGLVHL